MCLPQVEKSAVCPDVPDSCSLVHGAGAHIMTVGRNTTASDSIGMSCSKGKISVMKLDARAEFKGVELDDYF